LGFGLIGHQFVGASGADFKHSMAVVNMRVARSLCPGVVSATLLGVKYSSSSLAESYSSKDD
jgi:hypothetical protein